MKVRVSFTVEVDECFRRALNHYYGHPGLASREMVRRWYEDNASSVDADMLNEYDHAEAEQEQK